MTDSDNIGEKHDYQHFCLPLSDKRKNVHTAIISLKLSYLHGIEFLPEKKTFPCQI